MLTDATQGVLTALPPLLLLYYLAQGEIGHTRRSTALIVVMNGCALILAALIVVPGSQRAATLGVGAVFLLTGPPALYTISKERAD